MSFLPRAAALAAIALSLAGLLGHEHRPASGRRDRRACRRSLSRSARRPVERSEPLRSADPRRCPPTTVADPADDAVAYRQPRRRRRRAGRRRRRRRSSAALPARSISNQGRAARRPARRRRGHPQPRQVGPLRADVCGVVTQRGQFCFVRGGAIPAIDEAHAAYRTAVAVAKVALADAWDSAAPRRAVLQRAPAPPRWQHPRRLDRQPRLLSLIAVLRSRSPDVLVGPAMLAAPHSCIDDPGSAALRRRCRARRDPAAAPPRSDRDGRGAARRRAARRPDGARCARAASSSSRSRCRAPTCSATANGPTISTALRPLLLGGAGRVRRLAARRRGVPARAHRGDRRRSLRRRDRARGATEPLAAHVRKRCTLASPVAPRARHRAAIRTRSA